MMTYIYQTVTASDMTDAARAFGEDRYLQLGGYCGIRALHDYLEGLAEDIGEPIELDIIALCCDWAHYVSEDEAMRDYDQQSFDDIRKSTFVLDLEDGTFLIQSF